MSKKQIIFFDVHNHLFTLNHPGFVALIKRFLMNNNLDIDDLVNGKFVKIILSIISGLIQFPIVHSGISRKIGNRLKINVPVILTALSGLLVYISFFILFLFLLINLIVFNEPLDASFPAVTSGFIMMNAILIIIAVNFINKKMNSGYSNMVKKPVNLLYFMEMDVANQLIMLENDVIALDPDLEKLEYLNRKKNYGIDIGDDIRNYDEHSSGFMEKNANDAGKKFVEAQKLVKCGNFCIAKFVLTPLIMDFGKKFKSNPDIDYSYSYIKPVFNQVTDLLFGIKRYMVKSPFRLFEVFPFLGINVKNYTLSEIEDLLNTYFKNYKPGYKAFSDNFHKTFDEGSIDLKVNENGAIIINGDGHNEIDNSMFFAGIKVYPPMGFDFWPDDSEELVKVKRLFEFCNKKALPITVHYGNGGFETYDEAEISGFLNKQKLEKIFEHLVEGDDPLKIKINLSHMGTKYDRKKKIHYTTKFTDNIFSLMEKYPDNVFTDMSNRPLCDSFDRILARYGKFHGNILFGSDMPVVLFAEDNYKSFLKQYVDRDDYEGFYSENAMRFLFE